MSGPEHQVSPEFQLLLTALRENTDAVRRLADSCAALIEAMAMADEGEDAPMYYMDGTPIERDAG